MARVSEMSNMDSDSLNKVISTRKALLPAVKMTTDEYYTAKDAQVSIAETKNIIGREIISLTGNRFGSSPSFQLFGNKMLEFVILHLRLPKVAAWVSGARMHLPHLWGYSCIKDIRVTYGSSNTTLYKSGSTLLQEILAQYETLEKANTHLLAGGDLAVQLGASNGNYKNWIDYEQDAYVFLNLSTFSVQSSQPHCHKSIPLDIIEGPVSVTVNFKEGRDFVNNYDPTWTTTFTKAEVMYRAQEFTDNSFSLKHEILQNPEKVYSMPYYQARSGPVVTSKVARTSSTNLISKERVDITLTSLENSDLVAIMLQVIPQDYEVLNTTSYRAINPAYNCQIEDIVLSYGGDRIINMPGDSIKVFSQYTSNKSGSIGNTLKVVNSTTNTDDLLSVGQGVPVPTHIYPIILDLSHTSFSQCSDKIENTPKYISSELLLSFTVLQDIYNDDQYHTYNTHVTYVYPGVLSFQHGSTSSMLL